MSNAHIQSFHKACQLILCLFCEHLMFNPMLGSWLLEVAWIVVFFVRPLLDNGLKGGNSESPERAASVFAFCVCLSIFCMSVNKLHVDTGTFFLMFFEVRVQKQLFLSCFEYWPQQIFHDLRTVLLMLSVFLTHVHNFRHGNLMFWKYELNV